MAIQLKSANVVKPTDQLICDFRGLEHTPMERPLSRTRLDHLRREMAAGRFLNLAKWARVYCKHNGRHYRLNGQHTSTVFAERPEAERPLVVYEHFECDTPAEVAALFQGYDSRESVRSAGDITRAVFSSSPDLAGYPVRLGQALVGGLAMLAAADREWAEGVRQDVKSTYRGKSAMDKASAAINYAGFAAWLKDEFGGNEPGALLGRAPVVCAMLATRRADQAAAETFWKEVRDGTNPNPKSGSRVLREYLLAVRLSSSGGGGTRTAAGQREVLAKCLSAWRAWREGGEVYRLAYRETSLLPEVN